SDMGKTRPAVSFADGLPGLFRVLLEPANASDHCQKLDFAAHSAEELCDSEGDKQRAASSEQRAASSEQRAASTS
ncbi:hypothetical protein, partial [Eggerthella lenta]|uniref:hypothetical protein n=1 Tax=Eggerthella lenta TaxID=84112 RepID=UPI001C6A0640